MAIEDYLKRKRKLETETDDLLTSQELQVPVQSNDILNNVRSGRSNFLGNLNLPPELTQAQGRKLDRNATGVLDKYSFGRRGDLLKGKFDYYFNLAEEAGLDAQTAMDFARKKSQLSDEQQFMAEQSALDRASQRKMLDLSQIYADRGIALQDQYSRDDNSALFRALGVGVGSLGTAYLLNRQNQPKEIDYNRKVYGGNLGNTYNLYDSIYNRSNLIGNVR